MSASKRAWGRSHCWWIVVLVVVNVGLYASVLVDRRVLSTAATRIIPRNCPEGEVVRALALYVRDELHHCNRDEVLRMPFARRWNYLYNPFRIGPRTAMESGGLHTGACGSSSRVLMEFLKAHGIDSQFVLLQRDDSSSIHTLLEVRYAGTWGAVDPLYGIVYQHPDGRPASLRELRADEELFLRNAMSGWEYGYGPKRQSKRHQYDANKYPFRNARYFNYGKFGVLSRSVFHVLYTCFGEEGPLWIRRPNFYAYPALTSLVVFDCGVLGSLLLCWSVRRVWRRLKGDTKSAPN